VKAFITGSAMYAPKRIVSNEEIAGILGLTPQRIYESSGIRRRHWAEGGVRTSALAAQALCRALDDAELRPDQIDYLVLGTMTPDHLVPGTAPAVQKSLGLPSIPALDIRNTCCNTLYGLQLARSLVGAGTARHVALCFAELQSAWLDLTPASGTTSMLFGDGAAAMIVSAPEHRSRTALQVVDVQLRTDGSYTEALGLRGPGPEWLRNRAGDHRPELVPHMNGQKVLLRASRSMAAVCRTLLASHDLRPQDVRWIVPHQANENVMHQLLRLLGIARHADRLVSIMSEYGNTSSASMGMALDSLRRSGRLQAGDYILMPAFGAGFTWGAALCVVSSST
jgi:3-oxoacyl-[acyl-carrier-protein] synthase-3